MTLRRWNKMYEFYKIHHDLETQRVLYSELKKENNSSGEWFPD